MARSKQRRIAIVTDSTASLAPADAAREGIEVVPLQVIIGADTYTEGEDVTSEMIAEALAAFVPVSTSRPSPEEFATTYRRLAKGGADEIVSIHLSSRMSGTIDAARLAAREVKVPVTVVDTELVGVGVGFAAGAAARAVASGRGTEEVVEAAQAAAWSTTVTLYVDTLEYLKRGGRVGTAAAFIGSALAVKPILTIEDGSVVPLERVRTAGKALARLEELAVEAAQACDGDYAIGLQHLANERVATAVAGRLAAALDRDVPVDEVGAAIGAHVGPGMVSVTVTPTPQ